MTEPTNWDDVPTNDDLRELAEKFPRHLGHLKVYHSGIAAGRASRDAEVAELRAKLGRHMAKASEEYMQAIDRLRTENERLRATLARIAGGPDRADLESEEELLDRYAEHQKIAEDALGDDCG